MKKIFYLNSAKLTSVLTFVLMTLVAGFGFTACHDDDDDEEMTENTSGSSENQDYVHSAFIVSENVFEIADVVITYEVNGVPTKKTIDPESAIDRVEKEGLPCKYFYVVDKQTERPLKVSIATEPKANLAEIVEAKKLENIETISVFRNGIVKTAATTTPLTNCQTLAKSNSGNFGSNQKLETILQNNRSFYIAGATFE